MISGGNREASGDLKESFLKRKNRMLNLDFCGGVFLPYLFNGVMLLLNGDEENFEAEGIFLGDRTGFVGVLNGEISTFDSSFFESPPVFC